MGNLGNALSGNQFVENGSPQVGYTPSGNAPQFQSTDYGSAISQALQQAGVGNKAAGTTSGQQSQLAGMLFGLANGQGPNPALLQQQQQTNANTGMTNGLIASQRGMNTGLAARDAAYANAAANQQSVGQGALMSAEQQLGATSQLGSALANQQAGNLGLINANNGILNTAAQGQQGQNNTQLGLQGLAQQTGAENANLAQQADALNAGVQGQNVQSGSQLLGASMGALGAGLAAAAKASKGGRIRAPMAKRVPVLVSPGEKMLPPEIANNPLAAAWMASHGPSIPGHSPYPGDDSRNDTVLTMAPEGTVVLPRTKANKPALAAAFVSARSRRHGLDDTGTSYTKAVRRSKMKGRA
jgi:hypothetical protein